MHTKNEQLVQFLDYFVGLKTAPNYAVLIKGPWGTGKSWIVKDFLKRRKETDKSFKYIYVSLYGLGSTADIDYSIYQALHPVLSSNAARLGGKVIKGLLKASIKLDFDGDKKEDASLSPTIPDINFPDYLKNTDDFTLVFDDLERCDVRIQKLLGYINHFVEHQDHKVILVANTDEIESVSDNETDYAAYYRIKEKLIGKEIHAKPDVTSALGAFLSELSNKDVSAFLAKISSDVEQTINDSEIGNLRSVRQAILDFERLWRHLPANSLSVPELLTKIFNCLLAFSLEIKAGNLSAKDIDGLKHAHLLYVMQKGKDGADRPIEVVTIEKYRTFDITDPLPSAAFFRTFFETGAIDSSALNDSILNSSFFTEKNTQPWVQLWHYLTISENTFHTALSSVQNDLKKFQITCPYVLMHILGIYLSLSKDGLISLTRSSVLKSFKLYTSNLLKRGLLEGLQTDLSYAWVDEHYAGLGYHNHKESEFLEGKRHLIEMLQMAYKMRLPELAMQLFSFLNNDTHRFCRAIYFSGSGEKSYHDVPILFHISESDFTKALLSLDMEQQGLVCRALRERYKSVDASKLVDEVKWLKAVIGELQKSITASSSKLFRVQTDRLLSQHLQPALDHLNARTTVIVASG